MDYVGIWGIVKQRQTLSSVLGLCFGIIIFREMPSSVGSTSYCQISVHHQPPDVVYPRNQPYVEWDER